jgi:hypothetical protein
MDSVNDAVDRVLDTQKATQKDDAIKAAALANNLAASLEGFNMDDMDLGDLLGTAGQLSDLLRGLVDNSTGLARSLGTNPAALTPAAKAALELDKLLAKLEGKDEPETLPQVENLNITLPPVQLSGPSVNDSHFQMVDLSTAVSFEDVAAAVAYDLHQKAKAISSEGDQVAMELANLSKFARAGDRQNLLMAAKAAAAHIQAFCRKLTELAKAIPCRNDRERRQQDLLLKTAQGLRDYATQLKILAAVKAATIEDSKDTDATLASLTRNLGGLLSQGLTAMHITQTTMIGRK